MIAIKILHNDEWKIVLAFDDGNHAIHHGMGIWTIEYVRGWVIDYDSRNPPASPEQEQIHAYVSNYANQMGRIISAIIP